VQTKQELTEILDLKATAEQVQAHSEEQAQSRRAALLALDAKEAARMKLRDAGERAEAEAIAGLVKKVYNWMFTTVQGA